MHQTDLLDWKARERLPEKKVDARQTDIINQRRNQGQPVISAETKVSQSTSGMQLLFLNGGMERKENLK